MMGSPDVERTDLTPQPPSHLSLTLPYKGREKEKLF
jgi:hypothetical protein